VVTDGVHVMARLLGADEDGDHFSCGSCTTNVDETTIRKASLDPYLEAKAVYLGHIPANEIVYRGGPSSVAYAAFTRIELGKLRTLYFTLLVRSANTGCTHICLSHYASYTWLEHVYL
jgi:hypothetical protein